MKRRGGRGDAALTFGGKGAEEAEAHRRWGAYRPGQRLIRTVLREAAAVAEEQDPLAAEMWASSTFAFTYGAGPAAPGEPSVDVRLAQLLIDGASGRRSVEALVLLRAIAAAGPPEVEDAATRAADRLVERGVEEAEWVSAIGSAAFDEAWRVTHPLGDQEVVLPIFRYPGRSQHLLSVLIDHNLGSIAKSIGLSNRPDVVVGTWRDDPEFSVDRIDAAEAGGRIAMAIAATDTYIDPAVEEDLAEHRALALGRVRSLPAAWVGEPRRVWSEPERQELVEGFVRSEEGRGAGIDEDVVAVVTANAVDYLCDVGAGDPLRWNPVAVELFLVDWLPRKVMLDDDEIDAVPEVLRALILYGSGRAELGEHLVLDAVAAVDRFETDFRTAARDAGKFGPAKAFATAMRADAVDLTDEAAVRHWIDDFNARPEDERRSILGE